MKRFYLRFRIFLLTLAFGLACVPFFDDVYKRWVVLSIDVPEVQSEAPLYIVPGLRKDIKTGGGGGSGCRCSYGLCVCDEGYGDRDDVRRPTDKSKGKKDRLK